MPDVVLLTPMLYGAEDGSVVELEPGETLTMGDKAGEKDGKPVYTEDQIKEYIRGGVAFDRSGELNAELPSILDVKTLERDAMLLEAGQPVHVDGSNPLESAQKHVMQDQPAAIERQTVVDNIVASDQVETPKAIVEEQKAKAEAVAAEAKAKAAKPSGTTQTAQANADKK